MSFVDELEDAARQRFVHWDTALWHRFLAGPAAALSQSLSAEPEGADRILESYLRLACEGVGLGYLFPAESGAENAFSLAWNELLPKLLARVPADRRAAVLAACWNLGENLELSPLWVRRIFHRTLRELTRLDELESAVEEVSHEAFDPPDSLLTSIGNLAWLDLGQEDRRFLPGGVHFLAPRVACVHDRERIGARGVDPVTCGVWLAARPLPLGAMGCKETSAITLAGIDPALLSEAQKLDPRFDAPLGGDRNPHSALVTLATSQYVMALLP